MSSNRQFWEWLNRVESSANSDKLPAVGLFESTREYLSHSLVKDKFFYTIPVDLLRKVVAEVGYERFDASLLEMEFDLAMPCGDHSRYAGYWNGAALSYRGLRLRYARLLSDKDKEKKWPQLKENFTELRIYDVEWDYPTRRRDFRSFAGWLLTHRPFLKEHDQLWLQNVDVIRRWGTGQKEFPATDVIYTNEANNPFNDPEWVSYSSQRRDFLIRWRLGGLPGPYLTEPLEPNMDGWIDLTLLKDLGEAGGVYFVPDTVPLPSRDELRESIEDSRGRRKTADHLSEWFEYIRPNNSARNQLDRFSRIFELQHYWRLLHERHPQALKNAVGKLEYAFASWFDVSRETIRQDLIRIRRCLGSNWLARTWPM
jgi:hypothetical protein